MSKQYNFEYSLCGDHGFCHGASAEQARDNAKVKWLARKGITVKSPKFAIEKARLKDHYPKLKLFDIDLQRFKELYRCAKDAQLMSKSEVEEFTTLQSIVRNL